MHDEFVELLSELGFNSFKLQFKLDSVTSQRILISFNPMYSNVIPKWPHPVNSFRSRLSFDLSKSLALVDSGSGLASITQGSSWGALISNRSFSDFEASCGLGFHPSDNSWIIYLPPMWASSTALGRA